MVNALEVFGRIERRETPITVVGLGYVGLPLACLLAKKFKVTGYDINETRVKELREGYDKTKEIEDYKELKSPNLTFTTNAAELSKSEFIIVTVPTPIDGFNRPDLKPLVTSSQAVGKHLKKGAVVVYESTVYPGLTETVCAQHLTENSGLTLNKDFYLGYSPERVNPGDKLHTIDKILKVVSGSTPEVTELLAKVYGAVITAGIHLAPNIATAEAAKVIENTQRDLNIALVNELAMIFDKIGLDTLDVLAAARTKWNFLDFRPGLVGGHCIGVDPYYLTHRAEGVGFHPDVILSGRRTNDGMGAFVAQKTISLILTQGKNLGRAPVVGILGATFKENVPDLRNTKVVDMAQTLEGFGAKVFIHDPVAHSEDFVHEYGRHLTDWSGIPQCDAIILAVRHEIFTREYPLKRIAEKLSDSRVVIDIKGSLDRKAAKDLGLTLWRV